MSATDMYTFNSYTTPKYKLHNFEVISGIRMVLISDVGLGDMRAKLKEIFYNIYVEYVTKNVLTDRDEYIESGIFQQKLKDYFKQMTAITTN